MKILYVDDDRINLKLFQIAFRKKYTILIANGGREALEVLGQNSDILICVSDMKMPEMNGIELITQAKKIYPEIKFFILTGFDLTQEIQSALNSELIIKYLRKPMNVKEVEAAIEDTL